MHHAERAGYRMLTCPLVSDSSVEWTSGRRVTGDPHALLAILVSEGAVEGMGHGCSVTVSALSLQAVGWDMSMGKT